MKKISLLVFLFAFSIYAKAQKDEKSYAMELITKNAEELGLNNEEVQNSIVNSTYYNKTAGTQMVYLQQSYLGLPILNQFNVIAFKNGKVVSQSGNRINNISEKAGTTSTPSINSLQAVKNALYNKGVSLNGNLKSQTLSATKFSYGKADVALENITSELMWVPLDEGKKVKLAWQIFFVPLKSSDYFLINVDAVTGSILNEFNLTVYCNFHHEEENIETTLCDNSYLETSHKTLAPEIVSTANYLVIPYPAESRLHTGGTPTIVTNPWTMAPGNATSLGWHNDGSTDYLSTRGNNAFVQEDRDNNNSTFGLPAGSTTGPDPLNFIFTPDFTVTPTQSSPVQNQQFNLTNLFYWNNIIHDLSYQYGFDESAGNFQNSNLGRGGLGTDYVIVDAQDGGGTNNANFSTPPDGTKPRMQMYLWGNTSLPRDGGTDNGVVTHEYAHGISNRLTGGPNSATCMSSGEQMGEGISDYFGLMYTQNWATSNLNSGFANPRAVGIYAAGQSINGGGIRSKKYTTNFTINDLVYKTSIPSESHDRGEIWCSVLWDMTWNIINQTGVINPNLFDANAEGGNTIALKLVMEGMKLQPCNPGFISARDAILQADQILYNGAYSCSIKEAFRRRGMGAHASEGSSDNVNDQVPDFSSQINVVLTQGGITSVPEGQNITYTNTVSSDCQEILNYKLLDTLPSNVTYVSGGNYNAATRVVSFDVNQAAGETQTYSFVVKINNGSYFDPVTLFNEPVAGSSIPATWSTTASSPSNIWTVSSVASHSAPNSFYTKNYSSASEQILKTVNPIALPAGSTPTLTFWHRFNTEPGWDGGVVEISLNNVFWIDLGPYMKEGAYNDVIGDAPTSTLSNKAAFSGNSGTFIKTKISLAAYEGKNIRLRYRFASEDNTAPSGSTAGWFVDDINILNSPLVLMSTSLMNATGVRVSNSDTVTAITQQNSCNDISITQQPSNKNGCVGGSITFKVVSQGSAPTYQWQISTNGGTTYTNISGATLDSLVLSGLSASLSGNKYRVVVTNACSNSTSTSATLSVSTPASITSQPSNLTLCSGNNGSINVTASGSANTYQWQVSTSGGDFQNINGATTATLNLSAVTSSMDGNTYRVIVSSCGGPVTSAVSVLTVNSSATITTQPANTSVCEGSNGSISVGISGTGTSIQWQISTDGGNTFSNITGATSSTLNLNNVSASMNNNRYRAVITNSCTTTLNSSAAILNVSTAASIVNQPVNFTGCSGTTASFAVNATGSSNSYQWQVSTDGTNFSNITGANSATLNLTNITSALNGNKYRVIVGSCATPVNSTAATLSVNSAAAITSQPTNATGCVGNSVSFNVNTTGSNVSYQWQVSIDGGTTFTNIAGETTASLSINNLTTSMNGNRYRVVINNTCTTALNSGSAILTISAAAAITNQPTASTACVGSNTTFSVATSGSVVGYQWQVSSDGGATFTDITGATNAVLSLTNLTGSMDNNQYKVVITSCGSNTISSNTAILHVTAAATFTTQPSDRSVCIGAGTTFNATASGANLNYQWQVSTNGGTTFTNISGANTNSYTLSGATSTMNGNKYRVVLNGDCATNLNSNAATLNVNAGAVINTQPVDQEVCEGGNAIFSASVADANSFQWQISTDGGATFSDISGATSSTLNLNNINSSMSNNRYRLIANGSCGNATSAAGNLSVNSLPEVGINGPTQPVCAGTSISLSGTGAISYNWNNGVVNSSPFTINNSGTYTVIGTDVKGCTNTKSLLVDVIPNSIVTISASSTTLSEGSTVTLTASSNPSSSIFKWFKGGVEIAGQTGNTLAVQYPDQGSYTAKDIENQCGGTSNLISLSNQEQSPFRISPNPNFGQFIIWISNEGVTAKERHVVVYDSKGARIYNKVFAISPGITTEQMQVNITNATSGIYMVTIFENNKAVKSAKIYIH